MIEKKQRNCRNCQQPFLGNTILCMECAHDKKKAVKKQIDINSLKGAKTSSKRVKSQEELDIEKKKKAAEKALKAKERAKKRKESKRAEKLISMTNLQVLYQKFIRLVTPDKCSSCGIETTSAKGGNQKNAGHCIEKGKAKSTALLMTNMYAQCWNCNNKNIGNGRPIDLYKFGQKYWGDSSMIDMHNMSKITYSFDKGERTELYDYIVVKIKEAETLIDQKSKDRLLKEVYYWQQSQLWYKQLLDQI